MSEDQIATWVSRDTNRRYCARPWSQVTVLSDGTAVCACVDSGKKNPLGNLREGSFEEVWDGPGYVGLREAIATDIDQVEVCRGCPNRIEGPPPPEGYVRGIPKPEVLFLESYAGCNLTCPGCDRDAIEGTRTDLALDWDTYTKLIDDLSPGLKYMEFHVGGENYMHKRANPMVAYCKERNPDCYVLSSTNGHFFHTDDRIQDVFDSGIDCLIFSIDGATQESYEKYRVNGRLDRVLKGMRRMIEMRNAQGRQLPLIVWRYILFSWNSSQEEMDLARSMADEIGVDQLAWHLNVAEGDYSSPRYYIGSPHLPEIRDELWDTMLERVDVKLDYDVWHYPPPVVS